MARPHPIGEKHLGAYTDRARLWPPAFWRLLSPSKNVAYGESTGVYWSPVYEILEQRGLVVNVRYRFQALAFHAADDSRCIRLRQGL